MVGVVLSNTFQCVQPAMANRACSDPSCSTALTYSSVSRRSAASCSVAHCRRQASTSVNTAPAPAPTASATLIISSRAVEVEWSTTCVSTSTAAVVDTTIGMTTTVVDHHHNRFRSRHHRGLDKKVRLPATTRSCYRVVGTSHAVSTRHRAT